MATIFTAFARSQAEADAVVATALERDPEVDVGVGETRRPIEGLLEDEDGGVRLAGVEEDAAAVLFHDGGGMQRGFFRPAVEVQGAAIREQLRINLRGCERFGGAGADDGSRTGTAVDPDVSEAGANAVAADGTGIVDPFAAEILLDHLAERVVAPISEKRRPLAEPR